MIMPIIHDTCVVCLAGSKFVEATRLKCSVPSPIFADQITCQERGRPPAQRNRGRQAGCETGEANAIYCAETLNL